VRAGKRRRQHLSCCWCWTGSRRCRERLSGYKFITLTAAPGKDEFYLKLGWLRQATAMIWPVSEQQRELHAVAPVDVVSRDS
jgi:hypothetical protein